MAQGFTKGVPIDTDPNLSANSNLLVPSQAAIVQYVNNQISSWKTDYNNQITGIKNSVNLTFSTSQNFKPGSLKIYMNGLRLTPGATFDYVETGANIFQINYAPDSTDILIAEYETIP